MSQNLSNIYIDRFLLVAFVKLFITDLLCYFFKKIFLKSFDIYFFYPKISNFHNSGMVGRRKLPDPSMNNILSWFWSKVQCYNKAKMSILKIQGYCPVQNFPISETGRNCSSLFKLVDNNWIIIIMEQKIRQTVGHMSFMNQLGFQ